jgi:hypothetical protein
MFSIALCYISYPESCLKRVLRDSADTKKVQQINSRFNALKMFLRNKK